MNPLSAAEIGEIIKSKISNVDLAAETRNEGVVLSVNDGIVRIYGLSAAKQGEMLEFPGNTYGLALNLESDSVGAVILGPYEHLSEGDSVKCTGRVLEVPVGEALLGRIVNSLGAPIDGGGEIASQRSEPLEKIAPGVIWRQSVSQPLQTGLKAIDTMVPIGRGQRELIIGDRQTGQNRHRHRRDYQPERQKLRLRLCRHRAKGVFGRRRRAQIGRARRARAHDCRFGDGFGFRGRCNISRLTPVARWPNTSAIAARTRSSFTTI